MGFLADAICGLAQISPEAVDRTPPFGTRFPPKLVTGMAPFEGGFVPILDCDRALQASDAPVPGGPTT